MIERADWSLHAEHGLKRALGEDLPIIRKEVEKGGAQLWRVNFPDRQGWAVTRIEQGIKGLVLHMVAGEGWSTGRGYLKTLAEFQELARQNGFAQMRLTTSRRGIERLAGRCGFEYEETVMLYEVDHG